ncbi:MAG: D-alanyl-D-alanine carboxypeptidase [Parcubacteria group bacterium GW2011_GWA2_51_12]|nr:MAG: D-alanyl-D-alanine carboxypeptidase [Parcubacteria group bacterium GW2011_GWA2_51_12]
MVFAAAIAAFLGLTDPSEPSGRVGGASIASTAAQQLPLAPDRVTPRPPVPLADGLDLSISGLSARAILVKDPVSGYVLFEKKVQETLPIASLTKLMTAMVVNRRVQSEELVEISWEDTQMALARHAGGSVEVFVTEMNKEAERLGMEHTSFENPVGFDAPNHYSTAADLSLLVEEFLRYPELLEIVSTKSETVYSADRHVRHSLLTTNRLMMEYPQIVGLKTGYTAEAKGNLIILSDDPGHPGYEYFSIVLGSDNREAETSVIMNWVLNSFRWAP